jgi:hypothetical protein
MNFATKSFDRRILVWIIWLIAVLVFISPISQPENQADSRLSLLGVVTHDSRDGPLFPWQTRYRWKKWALA